MARDRKQVQADYRARVRRDPELHNSRLEAGRRRNKINYALLKSRIIRHYGGKCACCDETDIRFLTIDHLNGGGTRHRAELGGGGWKFYSWIQGNKFPKLFRVLCWNCNSGTHFNGGICPHRDGYGAKINS